MVITVGVLKKLLEAFDPNLLVEIDSGASGQHVTPHSVRQDGDVVTIDARPETDPDEQDDEP